MSSQKAVSPSPSPSPALAAMRDNVDFRLLDLVFGLGLLNAATTFVLVPLFAFLVEGLFPSGELRLWVIALELNILLCASIYGTWHFKKKAILTNSFALWRAMFTLSTLLGGAAWALGPILLIPLLHGAQLALLIGMVATVAAVGANTMAAHPPGMLAFLVATLAPTAVMTWVTGDEAGRLLSLVLLSCLGGLMIAGTRAGNHLREHFNAQDLLRTAVEEAGTARALAESANQAKSQFLSAMSHEIRTPLNGVLGMAELLMSTPLNAEQVRFVGAIDSAGRVLHGLLSDILDLAKIEEGKVKLEQIDFDPRQTALDLSSVFSALASQSSIAFKTDVSALTCTWVSGDPTRLRQVLSNLLSNAVKFTPHGEIHLHGESIPAPAGLVPGDIRCWCRFSVEDTGIGMSPKTLEKLFNRFEQADTSTTRHFGGSGLGLAISRHLVELMGGQIYVHSTVGVGSRFWFDLPLAAAMSPVRPANLEVATVSLTGVRILVAEDNAINQLVVKNLLIRLGADLTLVENGELAVEAVQADKDAAFDLIFMDCQMPVMDGFEATRQIRIWERAQAANKVVPIIALTANALAGDRDACLAAGMTDYVTKPITSAALAQVLERNRAKFLPALQSAPAVAVPQPSLSPERPPAVYDPGVLGALPMVLDGTDVGFADEMLALFSKNAHMTLVAIDNAARDNDLAALTRLVHTLKSSAAQVGALALSAQAGEQEALLRAGRMGTSDWRASLTAAFEDFKQALEEARHGR